MDKFLNRNRSTASQSVDGPPAKVKRGRPGRLPKKGGQNGNPQSIHMIDSETMYAAKEKKKRLGDEYLLHRDDPSFVDQLLTEYKKELFSTKDISDKKVLNEHSIQELHFGPSFTCNNLKAICVPKDVAAAVKQGEKLYLRGSKSQNMVLCSENKTFEIQVNQIPGTLLLGDLKPTTSQEPISRFEQATISSFVSSDVCIATEVDNLDTTPLKDMLRETELQWDADEDYGDDKIYSMTDLLRTVQMSEGQIKKFLRRQPVIEVDGQLRWMSHQYRDRVLNRIVDLLDDDMNSDIEVRKTCPKALRKSLPAQVRNSAIEWYLEHIFDKNEDGTFRVNSTAMVQERAKHLLRASPNIDLPSFEGIIDELLPYGVVFRIEHLVGVAIISSRASGDDVVECLDKNELPDEHFARVRAMFAKRSLWPRAEIEPYLIDVFTSKWHMDEFLYECCERTDDGKGNTVYGGVVDRDC